MIVAIVYGPDDDCTDPLDEAKMPRRHGELIEDDVLVVWRERGEQFKGGQRTHFVGSGVFENVKVRKLIKVLDSL